MLKKKINEAKTKTIDLKKEENGEEKTPKDKS